MNRKTWERKFTYNTLQHGDSFRYCWDESKRFPKGSYGKRFIIKRFEDGWGVFTEGKYAKAGYSSCAKVNQVFNEDEAHVTHLITAIEEVKNGR